jgi:hypothetical protein
MIVKPRKNKGGFVYGCTNFVAGSNESCNALESFEMNKVNG